MTTEAKYYITVPGINAANDEDDNWWLKRDGKSWIHQSSIVAGLPESEYPGKFTRAHVQLFQKHQPAIEGVSDDGEIIQSSQSQP